MDWSSADKFRKETKVLKLTGSPGQPKGPVPIARASNEGKCKKQLKGKNKKNTEGKW